MTPLERLAAVAATQHGAFSRAQAHAAGLTDRRLRGLVDSGVLTRVGPHGFRAGLAPTTPLGELTALVLDVGAPCWVAGPTAAALHGFDGFRIRRPFHLVLPRDRNVRRIGAVIRTTVELPLIDRASVGELPATSAARTLVDLARGHSSEQLAAAYDSGLRDGRFSEDLVHRRIVALRSRGRFGIPRLLAVVEGHEITRGGHSWLEREFLRLCAAAGLPRPQTQQVLARAGDRLVRVDCRFPGTRVVVELLGYRYHRSRWQISRDTERLNALLAQGYLPYQFTYDQVVGDPDGTMATIAVALPGRQREQKRPRRRVRSR